MSTASPTRNQNSAARVAVIGVLVAIAFFAAYKFASAQSAPTATGQAPQQLASTTPASVPAAPAQTDPSAAGGCSCCGSSESTSDGVTGDPVEGAAQIGEGIQSISVDVSSVYSPNVIKLKAGIPAEITFGQGGGCTAQVMSRDLEFFEDLTQGPRTVQIAALEPGTYGFSCGMEMVFGKFVVE
jgi:hypothetical protein